MELIRKVGKFQEKENYLYIQKDIEVYGQVWKFIWKDEKVHTRLWKNIER